MRLDLIAYRVSDRHLTSRLFQSMFGYTIGTEFDIVFDNGSKADCIAMVPPEKNNGLKEVVTIPWSINSPGIKSPIVYHMAPEVFISDGEAGSIVGEWVASRDGQGGIHHLAYQVEDIDGLVSKWASQGIGFLTDSVIDCPDDELRQIFTKPLHDLGGVIVELIERGDQGFCQKSVKNLMNSTKGL